MYTTEKPLLPRPVTKKPLSVTGEITRHQKTAIGDGARVKSPKGGRAKKYCFVITTSNNYVYVFFIYIYKRKETPAPPAFRYRLKVTGSVTGSFTRHFYLFFAIGDG